MSLKETNRNWLEYDVNNLDNFSDIDNTSIYVMLKNGKQN